MSINAPVKNTDFSEDERIIFFSLAQQVIDAKVSIEEILDRFNHDEETYQRFNLIVSAFQKSQQLETQCQQLEKEIQNLEQKKNQIDAMLNLGRMKLNFLRSSAKRSSTEIDIEIIDSDGRRVRVRRT